MGFTSAICFSWSWILRNVDFWCKASMICEVSFVEKQLRMGTCGGFFPQCNSDGPNLFTYNILSPSFPLHDHVFNLESTSLSRLCTSMCVCRISSWQLEIYMAKYLHVSQAFRPSLVPTVRPLTHGLQPILSSYRMRQCRTWGGQDLADTSLSKGSL